MVSVGVVLGINLSCFVSLYLLYPVARETLIVTRGEGKKQKSLETAQCSLFIIMAFLEGLDSFDRAE